MSTVEKLNAERSAFSQYTPPSLHCMHHGRNKAPGLLNERQRGLSERHLQTSDKEADLNQTALDANVVLRQMLYGKVLNSSWKDSSNFLKASTMNTCSQPSSSHLRDLTCFSS